MKSRWFLTIAILAFAMALAVVLFVSGIRRSRQRTREEWNRTAIATVSALASDTNWVASQISILHSQVLEEDCSRNGWMSGNLILFKSGEWIVYTNACQKEDRRLHDMFIGRASDGKWLYTTFHFCVGMKVLPMMGRPADLLFFQKEYLASEFNGSPDAVLGQTWPHQE